MTANPVNLQSMLVANRGEIARRVFATAKAMGMATVAVYTTQDADAPFVSDADQAVHLPGDYLDIDAIIDAARRTGAQCVHPGYGFLSENAAFAQAVADAGLIWVGPSPDVIETMGDKIAAKQAAEASGVPILPSSTDPANATSVGYPLLVKASAGGGGKGMRLVSEPAQLAEAVAAAQREASGAFGDDTVFLERYVPRARHVEIQVLADQHGNVVHLGERECSIQRRHQKIVEESPSPRLDDKTRSEMSQAALGLAKDIGYQSAGTVEFLLDDDSGEFFFLEVNTRLQVEHPVTEEVTGLDLVREQILVASGRELSISQSDVSFEGHAVEVRLYAEDPANDFLPSAGTLEAWNVAPDESTRWDSGVMEGQKIGVDYDPMLAKVIAHGPTRSEAAGRLARALEQLHLGGLTTNRDYLIAVLRSPEFLAGDTTTDFVERVKPRSAVGSETVRHAAVVAAMWHQAQNRRNDEIWGFAPTNWRNGGLAPTEISFDHPSLEEAIVLSYRVDRDGTFLFQGEEPPVATAQVLRACVDHVELLVEGIRQRHRVTAGAGVLHVQMSTTTVTLDVVPRFVLPGSELPAGGLVAPIPSIVVEIRCAVGDQVSAGQLLVILEAMKMEHHVHAPVDGTITAVPISIGQQLDSGTPLVTIDEPTDTPGDEGTGAAEPVVEGAASGAEGADSG